MPGRIDNLRTRLNDIRDERHFPAHMLDAHDEMLSVLDEVEHAYELLAFIEAGMSMSGEQMRVRWPEWMKIYDAAHRRFETESRAYAVKAGYSGARGTTDRMVDNTHAARHHWVFLPLIRECLTEQVQS